MSKQGKLGAIESLVSLAKFVSEGVHWLIGPAIMVGGPMYIAWESIVFAASRHGWWIYPVVVVLSIAAIFGLWMFVLFLNNRIRLMTEFDIRVEDNEERVRRLAVEALHLAGEIDELIGEHQTRPPTIYGRDASNNWQKDNWETRSRMFQKFMSKYALKAHTIILQGSKYTKLDIDRYRWRMSHINDHDIGEVRQTLVNMYIELSQLIEKPITRTTLTPRDSNEERMLPFEDK